MKNNTTLCFVAGRSGGHLLPCLTKAAHLAREQKNSILFFSTNTILDKKILQESSLVDHLVSLPLENVPYKKIARYPSFIFSFFVSFVMSLRSLWRHKPTKVVSMGGYISIPVCLAAYCMRIPIELYELNVIPGKAIRFLAPLSTKIFVCFEQSKQYFSKASTLSPYPLRFAVQEKTVSKESARNALGLNSARKTVVILGGSQGSLFLNTLIKEWLTHHRLLHGDIQIIHQTGAHQTTDWHTFYRSLFVPALLFDYRSDIALMYSAADIIVCRAGAGTLFEATFFHKKCIAIPLETATTDHQIYNAYALATQFPHLITVVEQKEIENNHALFFDRLNAALFDCTTLEISQKL